MKFYLQFRPSTETPVRYIDRQLPPLSRLGDDVGPKTACVQQVSAAIGRLSKSQSLPLEPSTKDHGNIRAEEERRLATHPHRRG